MMPGKILLLLIVFAISSPHTVMANCTPEQKVILVDCHDYLSRNARNIVAPKPWSPCCRKVRDVPNRDMECIIRLLSNTERIMFVEIRINNLEQLSCGAARTLGAGGEGQGRAPCRGTRPERAG